MAGTFELSIYGSIKQIPRASNWINNGYFGNSDATVFSYSIDRYAAVRSRNLASMESDSEWIPTKSGPAVLTISYNAAVPANGLDFIVHDGMSAVPIGGARGIGGGQPFYTASMPIVLPDRPVNIFLRNRGPAALTTGMTAAICWEAD